MNIVTRLTCNVFFREKEEVPDQETAEPDFSMVKSVNPEDPSSFKLSLQVALEQNTDLIMATDSDGYCVGLMVNKPGAQRFV